MTKRWNRLNKLERVEGRKYLYPSALFVNIWG